MSDRNGYGSQLNLEEIARNHHRIIKKLEEIKVKISDLKQAKKELLNLIKLTETEIISGLVLLEDSSDSE